jgi:hypothetical protein
MPAPAAMRTTAVQRMIETSSGLPDYRMTGTQQARHNVLSFPALANSNRHSHDCTDRQQFEDARLWKNLGAG